MPSISAHVGGTPVSGGDDPLNRAIRPRLSITRSLDPEAVQLGGDSPGAHSFRAKPQDPAKDALLFGILHERSPVALFDDGGADGRGVSERRVTAAGAPLAGYLRESGLRAL